VHPGDPLILESEVTAGQPPDLDEGPLEVVVRDGVAVSVNCD
jgi:hypothetical protein